MIVVFAQNKVRKKKSKIKKNRDNETLNTSNWLI
jgi:hypothetical protein